MYSRDDGGWYAEVIDRQTGETKHTTEIQPTEQYAQFEAPLAAAVAFVELFQRMKG